MNSMLENRPHHNIILDSDGHGGWNVYPLSSESESELMNYQRIRSYINSCNGLLLFTDRSNGEHCICNPTSNECKVIPLPPIIWFPPPAGFTSCWGFSGLGFDSRSNDYKFMVFVDHISVGGGSDHQSYGELYSLKTDSWKSLTGFPNIAFTDPCVSADGSIYWLSHVNLAINSFDFADETFSSFDISPFLQAGDYYHDVRLADDCGGSQLGLVAHRRNDHAPCRFEVWGLRTSTAAGWNIHKRWDFCLPQIFMDLQVPRYSAFGVIIIGFSGEIMYLADSNGEVFAYDCAADHLHNLGITLAKYSDRPVFISYVETAVRPSLPLDLYLSLLGLD